MVNGSGPTAVSVSPKFGFRRLVKSSRSNSRTRKATQISASCGSALVAAPSPQHGCKVQYAPRAKTLYLEDDTGTYCWDR